MILWEELGKELASWTKDRSANLSGVKTELMRLYSSADSIYVLHVKASSDPKDDESDAIQQPNLILYGTAESETLFNAFSASELTDGLVGRLMIFEGNNDADRFQQTEQIPIPKNILEMTDWWLEKRAMTINQEIPSPDIVPVMDEANEIFKQFQNIQKQLQYDRVKTTLWGRAQQQARQFALILLSSTPVPPIRIIPSSTKMPHNGRMNSSLTLSNGKSILLTDGLTQRNKKLRAWMLILCYCRYLHPKRERKHSKARGKSYFDS